jgi:hypothetical protein
VSVTTVPAEKLALHVDPQLMPTGALTTLPVPFPGKVTVKVIVEEDAALKSADTAVLFASVILQPAVPLQAPDQPPNVELAPGLSVNETCVPAGKLALQIVPQAIPLGELLTAPLPFPRSETVKLSEVGVEVLKSAVTEVFAFTVKLQLPAPLHGPDQPPKSDPVEALAVSVTFVPAGKLVEQVLPQLIPAGLLVTVPPPLPESKTVKLSELGGRVLKSAVMEVFAFTVRLQFPAPLHGPDQPPKSEPVDALAVSVNFVPAGKLAEQVPGQLIPAGLLLTVPPPSPENKTVKPSELGVMVLKSAVTEVFSSTVKLQLPAPLHDPDQPANSEPVDALAVSVRLVPAGKLAEQVPPQLIPAGLLVTVPLPEVSTLKA